MIDTGVRDSYIRIFEYIKENGRNPEDIGTIILSHSHPDHIGSAARIRKLTGCGVLAHENEKNWIEDIEIQAKERPVPGFFDLVDESVKIDRFLADGQEIEADKDVTLRILHAPGHSKGSINILFQEDRVLFTADSLPVKNDIPNYDNFKELMSSLKSIQANPNYDVLLTSWTSPLGDRQSIETFLAEGASYLKTLDAAVKSVYIGKETAALDFCRKTIDKLRLPAPYVNPIVDRAFKGHLI